MAACIRIWFFVISMLTSSSRIFGELDNEVNKSPDSNDITKCQASEIGVAHRESITAHVYRVDTTNCKLKLVSGVEVVFQRNTKPMNDQEAWIILTAPNGRQKAINASNVPEDGVIHLPILRTPINGIWKVEISGFDNREELTKVDLFLYDYPREKPEVSNHMYGHGPIIQPFQNDDSNDTTTEVPSEISTSNTSVEAEEPDTTPLGQTIETTEVTVGTADATSDFASSGPSGTETTPIEETVSSRAPTTETSGTPETVSSETMSTGSPMTDTSPYTITFTTGSSVSDTDVTETSVTVTSVTDVTETVTSGTPVTETSVTEQTISSATMSSVTEETVTSVTFTEVTHTEITESSEMSTFDYFTETTEASAPHCEAFYSHAMIPFVVSLYLMKSFLLFMFFG